MTLVQGVVLFILVKLISDFIGFTTISYLMNQVINYGAIAAVVIFAPELRSALDSEEWCYPEEHCHHGQESGYTE